MKDIDNNRGREVNNLYNETLSRINKKTLVV